MKRIDSSNARPNINGAGKAGFHDNNDISGQDATYLTPDWLNHIQEELCALLEKNGRTLNAGQRDQLFQLLATEDDVVALASATQQKIDNEATTRGTADNQLSQRISLLETFASTIIDRIYPIGVIIEFAVNFNPNSHFSGTTWVRHGEGRASVGLSTQASDPAWTKAIGTIFGEYQHTLSVNELPQHQAETKMFRAGYVATDGDWTYEGETSGFANDSSSDSYGTMKSKMIGGGVAHNIVQPSIVDLRWRRTA
ncbi:hypothetical protein MN869_18620 [Acinetobacter sp. NIPH1876]|uniref:phage baseplate protein n=1 Tax=Acinetobacter sp. NIPH1876 TaxID=2924041 RepID=UPI001FAC7104|nr:hypothetical protein [Acinetobacter sp. NIPH1876]MCJ0830431.1 hypothetical protein [Acinetobacter sp. NIPH1876]